MTWGRGGAGKSSSGVASARLSKVFRLARSVEYWGNLCNLNRLVTRAKLASSNPNPKSSLIESFMVMEGQLLLARIPEVSPQHIAQFQVTGISFNCHFEQEQGIFRLPHRTISAGESFVTKN